MESFVRACGGGDVEVARWMRFWESVSEELLLVDSGQAVTVEEFLPQFEEYVSPTESNPLHRPRSRRPAAVGSRDRADPVALLTVLNDVSLSVGHRMRAAVKLISAAGGRRAEVAAGLRALMFDRSVSGSDLVFAARVLHCLGEEYSKEACSVCRSVMADTAVDRFTRLGAADELAYLGGSFRAEGEDFLWSTARDDDVDPKDRIYALKLVRARSASSRRSVEALLAGIEVRLDPEKHVREMDLIECVRGFP